MSDAFLFYTALGGLASFGLVLGVLFGWIRSNEHRITSLEEKGKENRRRIARVERILRIPTIEGE
jgi:hypothetical protein